MTNLPETDFHKIFKASLHGKILIVTPVGDSVSFRDSDLDRELSNLIQITQKKGVKHLVVDLGESDYFGTVVIGVFNQVGNVVKGKGGKAVLCNSSKNMLSIIQVMNLDRIWKNMLSLEVAIDFVQS